MTDYTRSTGSSGTMLIRDNGTTVEFWLNSNNGTTWSSSIPWRYTINGTTSAMQSFNYQPGVGWKRLGVWTITTDQTVTFYLGDTGTSGFGGPTSFSQAITRTGPPKAPPAWAFTNIGRTSVTGDVNNFNTGGLTIDQVAIGYGTSSSAPQHVVAIGLNGTGTISGLLPATTYYFWVRTHNAKGYSPWGTRSSAKTKDVPAPPNKPVASAITQNSVKITFTTNGDGGSPILEYKVIYGIQPPLASSANGKSVTLTGLSAGNVYIVQAQVRNMYGWSLPSPAIAVTLFGGAWVDVNGVKKRAVPYVKHAGVWKVAQPYVKIQGLWKGTG